MALQCTNKDLKSLIKSSITIALNAKALRSFETDISYIDDFGIHFVVRTALNLSLKELQTDNITINERSDPFLPPFEKGLYICDIGDSHRIILNKFNVVDHHILICSREFRKQSSGLQLNDFSAAFECVEALDGLAFYNCGIDSGYSQFHFHVQVVPRSSVSNKRYVNLDTEFNTFQPQIPIEPLILKLNNNGKITTCDNFPFLHSVCVFSKSEKVTPELLFNTYIKGLEKLRDQINSKNKSNEDPIELSYNLLFTQKWILIVSRSKPYYNRICRCCLKRECTSSQHIPLRLGINALGFCGSIFVKSREDLELVERIGPMEILKEVAILK